jgi:hypothetical protein
MYYDEVDGKFVHCGGSMWHSGNGLNIIDVEYLDVAGGTWEQGILTNTFSPYQNLIYDQAARKSVHFGQSAGTCKFYDHVNRTISGAKAWPGSLLYVTMAYDWTRQRGFTVGSTRMTFDIDWDAETVTVTGGSFSTPYSSNSSAVQSNYASPTFDPDNDRFWMFTGSPPYSTLHEIDAAAASGSVNVVASHSLSGEAIPTTDGGAGQNTQMWNRMMYLKDWGCLGLLNSYVSAPSIIRVA